MLTLTNLQKQFALALNDEDAQIINHIRPSTRLDSQHHFGIYRNSVCGALQKVLKEIFPVCLKLVGEDFFLAMSNRYIQVTPSYSPDLGDYGDTFADFIANFPPASSVPYLADVARLEWAWHRIFEAPESKSINFQKLAECYETQGENIIFALPEGSFLLNSIYPIHQIWEMNQSDNDEQLILEDNQTFYFLVWRQHLEMRIDNLTADEWQLLTWVNKGLTLAEICARVEKNLPHISVSEYFQHFVTRGWLAGFKLAALINTDQNLSKSVKTG